MLMSEIVTSWILGIAWLAGVVLAKGFWSTAVAVGFPFWAWYLVVERALGAVGWMP